MQIRVDQVGTGIGGQFGGEPGGLADPAGRDRAVQGVLPGPEGLRDLRSQVTKLAEPGRGGDRELADQIAGDFGYMLLNPRIRFS